MRDRWPLILLLDAEREEEEAERERVCDLPGRIERHKMLEEGRSHEEASVTFFLTLSLSLSASIDLVPLRN